jgi:LysR family transcriptional regulator, benzoate and cis,cis-muconate-responsive activator of ben and cat genes
LVELRHLNYFVGVAEALNFRAAAEALHVSAPALSRQIRDLEEELGVRLLDRNTQAVRLTNSGAVFLGEVRKPCSRQTRC